MRTFQVSDVSPSTRPLTAVSLAASLYLRQNQLTAEAAGANAPSLVLGRGNAFLGAAHAAFDGHYPLVLSPDDVWLCIAQGFGTHVNQDPEALRARFVKHEGRANITIRRDDFVKGSPQNDWPSCFAQFSDAIAAHVGKARDLVVADFSTTGPVERAASEVVLMSAFQAYFEYVVLTMCGIPSISLLGTVEDWRSIRRRTEYLSEFGLKHWVDALLPVLDHFVRAAAGEAIDREFWSSFYKFNGGSGGPFVSGWINVFFPYLEHPTFDPRSPKEMGRELRPNRYLSRWKDAIKDEWGGGPTVAEFPKGMARAPFTWNYLGTEIPMALYGGFIGVHQDPQILAVRPAIGWAVQDTENPAPPPFDAIRQAHIDGLDRSE